MIENNEEQRIIYQSNWLAGDPYFYNVKTNKHGKNINAVIDYNDIEIDDFGLKAYLLCGYSVNGRTPIKNVHFIPPHSVLLKAENGKLAVKTLPDPVEQFLEYRLSESDIFELIRSKVQRWENEQADTIVIPTSGGYDSRLLNYMVKDKSRIRSISYGISLPQHKSFEVIYPRELSKILHTKWQHIHLGQYHKYISEWYELYGISTHAHGMYHIEFYRKYLQHSAPTSLLSGVVGDAFAKLEFPPILCANDVYMLTLSHGIHIPHSQLSFSAAELFDDYFNRKKTFLEDPRMRVVEAMRFKMILLSYLTRIPEYFGFANFGPFLDIDLAMAMLNLPPKRRINRIWQQEFMIKSGIDIENRNHKCDTRNFLNFYASINEQLQPLIIPDNINFAFSADILQKVKMLSIFSYRIKGLLSLGLDNAVSMLSNKFTLLAYLNNAKNRLTSYYAQQFPLYSAYLTLYPLCMIFGNESN